MSIPAAINSPARIIQFAMMKAGILQKGESPDSDDFATYSLSLLDIINFEQTQGLKLWLQQDTPMTIVAGKSQYLLTPGGDISLARPLRCLQAYVQQTSGVIRPLTIISRDEWIRLSNKGQSGAINSVFVDKQVNQLVINFWLTPDTQAALDTAHLLLQTQVTNFTTLTEGIDFPLEWFLFLSWALAAEIATGQPAAVIQRCEMKAETLRKALEDWDVEDASTFLQVDSRGHSFGQSFR